MTSLEQSFKNAVARASDQRGKPAILGKSDGTLYWVAPDGMTHRTRVWARVGERASNQAVVVDCLTVSPQVDMPVRVDHKNGVLSVISIDDKRAVEFGGGRPPGTGGAHAWLHSRLGPDPVYIEGLQYLPLLVTPTNPADLTVTVQAGAYYDLTGDLQVFDTAVSGSTSAYVPGSGYHFVIICLDRSDGSIVIVDGDDVSGGGDALFPTVSVTAADIESITIDPDYWPLAVVLLAAGQTQIKTKDIAKDLRPIGSTGGGGGTPGGADGQVQVNVDGDFGGSANFTWDGTANRLLVGGATAVSADSVLEVHDSYVNTIFILANDTASADLNTAAMGFYLKNSAEAQEPFAGFEVGSVDRTDGSEDGYFTIAVMLGGTSTPLFRLEPTAINLNYLGRDTDTIIQGDTATKLGVFDAGLEAFQVGTTVAGAIADFRPTAIVLNNAEADVDIRWGGNGVTNGYFYDAGNNRHGFGTGSPERSIHVVGDLIRIDRDGNSPGLITRRTTLSIGANADISTVNSEGYSSTDVLRTYSAFGTRVVDDTNGSEDALFRYRAMVAGTLTDVMSVGTNVGIGTLSPTEKLHVAGNVAPTNNDTWDVGTATFRWDDIYATNGTIQTSDANNKTEIRPSDLGLDFILSLKPVKYKFKNGKRDHYGLTGQQLETALNGRDFAGLTISEGLYGIRYTELIGPMIQAIHDLSAEVKRLGGKI